MALFGGTAGDAVLEVFAPDFFVFAIFFDSFQRSVESSAQLAVNFGKRWAGGAGSGDEGVINGECPGGKTCRKGKGGCFFMIYPLRLLDKN
ncbi:hypothetical protein [Cardiobacterium valvarum]|uniref:hypothetical protein n=1 Tax=Cardiobacterium valvarum TaxID=194702 RepID=UPI0011C01913|nr:hypothetical protein [Cardiobacterium valvarum]